MGVTHHTLEFTTSVAPARLFKALVLDSHNLLPKLAPQHIKSIEFVEGDGGVGSIRQTNYAEGSPFKYSKERIDEVDTKNLVAKFTLIEGGVLDVNLKSITNEVKFEASGDGGCVSKLTSEFHTAGNAGISEEEMKKGEEGLKGMHKAVEAFLLANPNAYA